MQRDKELETTQQKAEAKKMEFKKNLRENIISLKDVGYMIFKQGFDEAITQVKHFKNGALINLSKVN